MTLGDMSNLVLTLLQQPGASFTVGGGGGPNWAGQTNPQFSQGLVEFCINEAYRKFMGDIEDLELAMVSFTITSTASTYKYAIPPANYAPISHVARVFYAPKSQNYNWEFKPGAGLISWEQFQANYTGQGFLTQTSFGVLPRVVTVDPLLQNLYFYEGSASAGDTITVYYTPLPAKGATGCPTLVSATDTPLTPNDCHMCIVYWALFFLWIRAREQGAAQLYASMYEEEYKKLRAKYTKKHHGDNIRMSLSQDPLTLSRL